MLPACLCKVGQVGGCVVRNRASLELLALAVSFGGSPWLPPEPLADGFGFANENFRGGPSSAGVLERIGTRGVSFAPALARFWRFARLGRAGLPLFCSSPFMTLPPGSRPLPGVRVMSGSSLSKGEAVCTRFSATLKPAFSEASTRK